MNKNITIAVSSSSFSKNTALRELLSSQFSGATILYPAKHQDVLAPLDFIELSKAADYLIVGRERVDKDVLSKLPKLLGISKYGVGLDNIDFEAVKSSKIPVASASGVNAAEVAELTICLMVSVLRKVYTGCHHLKQGQWIKHGGTNLSGKKIGIIGCGHVGSKVAKTLTAMECEVLINDIVDKSAFAASIGASLADKNAVFSSCDVISFHTPLTPLTTHMVNASSIRSLKPGCTLINTARGAIIDEQSLISALESGHIGGAGLDVYEHEPHVPEKLYLSDNFVGTAHIGGSSREASLKMGRAAIEGLNRLILDRFAQE